MRVRVSCLIAVTSWIVFQTYTLHVQVCADVATLGGVNTLTDPRVPSLEPQSGVSFCSIHSLASRID